VIWVVEVPRDPLAFEEPWGSASEECGDGAPNVSISAGLQVKVEVFKQS